MDKSQSSLTNSASSEGLRSKSLEESCDPQEEKENTSPENFTALTWDSMVVRREPAAATHTESDQGKRRSRQLSQPMGSLEYTVSGSETLASIAAKFDTTTSELKKLNKLMTQMIWPGQKLFVPDKDFIASDHSSPATSPAHSPRAEPHEKPSFDLPVIKQSEHSKGPGIAKPVESTESKTEPPASNCGRPPVKRLLSEDEAKRLDEECYERFIKVNVKHITDGQGVVNGVLLVTPNAVMFDPNTSDPLVIDRGPNTYGLIAPMETVISVAMYQDIAAISFKTAPLGSDSVKPAVYHAESCPLAKDPDEGSSTQEDDDPEGEQSDQLTATPDLIRDIPRTRTRTLSVCSCGADVTDSPSSLSQFNKDSSQDQSPQNTQTPPGEYISNNQDTAADKPHSNNQDTADTTHSYTTNTSTDQSNRDNTNTVNTQTHSNDKTVVSDTETSVSKDSGIKEEDTTVTQQQLKETGEVTSAGNDQSLASAEITYQITSESEITSSPAKPSPTDNITHLTTSANISNTQSSAITQHHSEPTPQQQAIAGPNSEPTQQPTDSFKMILSAAKLSEAADTVLPLSLTPKPNDSGGGDNVNSVSDSIQIPGGVLGSPSHGFGKKPSDASLLSRTLGSISSFGSFTNSPGFSTIVDFSTGLFVRNQDDGGKVKDVSEVTMASPPPVTRFFMEGDHDAEENRDAIVTEAQSVTDGSVITRDSKAPSDKVSSSSGQRSSVTMVDSMSLRDKPELFRSLDELIPRPAPIYTDPPLYLCLRLGRPSKPPQSKTCPIEAYKTHKFRPEYWFSIPKHKVDQLYAFFVQWSPELYGDDDDIDAEARGFVAIENPNDDDIEVIEDYFESHPLGRDCRASLSKGWELFNKYFLVISHETAKLRALGELPSLPELLAASAILQDEHVLKLCEELPPRTEGFPWKLMYSTGKDGFSLKTLYRSTAKLDSPTLLVVHDTAANIFGAMLSCGPRMSDHFYGTGESYLYTFYPQFRAFRWTGSNNFFAKGNTESMAIGAGEGSFGLWFDGDLYHGRTQHCATFDNSLLTDREDFVIKAVEAWSFV